CASRGRRTSSRTATSSTSASTSRALFRELPDVVAKERDPLALARDAVDGDIGAADHEVGVRGGRGEAGLLLLLGRHLRAALEPGHDRLAVRDVTRRVLVEERVEEDDPGLAHPRRPVDERDLAERVRALVPLHVGLDHAGALARPDVDDPAAVEANLEIADDRP